MESTENHVSRWGRVRFGAKKLPAMAVAMPVGLLLSVGVAMLALASGSLDAHPVIGFIVVAGICFGGLTCLVWALIVERMSLRGAVPNAEQSVEAAWFDRAAKGAFTDTVTFVGMGLAVVSFTGAEFPVMLTLIVVLAVAVLSCVARFTVLWFRS